MKLFRRIFRMALLPVLLLVCSIHVSAANYYASTPEELLQILSYSYGQNNVIYLTADIDASGVYLQTKKDTGYIIRSDNGSSLSNATIGGTGTDLGVYRCDRARGVVMHQDWNTVRSDGGNGDGDQQKYGRNTVVHVQSSFFARYSWIRTVAASKSTLPSMARRLMSFS